VLHHYARFVPGADEDGIVRFLLSAAAIGILFKENASISGAEMGCQGEVGIEHNLGLTCDPGGGLVQIPCIARNAIA
jgi:L-serine dehydratase